MIILIILHILILSNLQFTAWPEMLSFPYMIDKGFLIYKDFHHVYQPLLTFVLLGFYKIFGFNLIALKSITYVIIALIDLMIFLCVKKFTKNKSVAILTLTSYIFLQPIFDGNMLWYDIAVTLSILVTIYFLDINLFISGFFIAISFLIKQQAVLIGLPILIYLLATKTKFIDIKKFLLGCLTPIVILVVLLVKYNLFNDYLFWTFEFPLIHLPKIEGYAIFPNTRELIILMIMALTLIVGIVTNLKKNTSKLSLLVGIMLLLVLSAFPRFSLFHLQPALAIFTILIGFMFSFKNKYFILLIIPLFLLWRSVSITASYEDRFYTQSDVNMGIEIKKTVGKDHIYLLGPSSIEYVMSDTIPSKPWIENYVWHFEIPELQEKVINGWTIDPPKYIYWSIPQNGNWYDLGTYQPEKIVKYIKDNYIKVSEIDNIEIWKIK